MIRVACTSCCRVGEPYELHDLARVSVRSGVRREYTYFSGVSGKSIQPVAPVAYQVILEPGIGQFREFESPRVHTRINS